MDGMDPPPSSPEPSRCRLLGPTGLAVQGIMGALVLISLVIKRQIEKRKRPWRIWMWDVSKQLVGQAVIHALNLLISDTIASAADNNPCSLYFLNVLIDTTIGVLIFYFALKGFTYVCAVRLALDGFISGQYGSPPQPKFWWRQLVPYLSSIVLMKLLVILPLTLPGISSALSAFGHALLDYLSPDIQVVFVLALFPLIMNIVQFCAVDQVIKAGKDVDVEGEGYARLGGNDDDVEQGRPDPRSPRRRKSSQRQATGSTPSSPAAPRSPLLASADPGSRSPVRKLDYGSTSPMLTPADLDQEALSPSSIWARLASVDRQLDPSEESGGSTATEGDMRDRHMRRSAAPSPDSFRVDATHPGHTSPPPTSLTGSRLSEDLRRVARQFSPRATPLSASGRFEDSVDLDEVVH